MDYWEVQYFNAKRIGITHYRIESVNHGLKIRMTTNMQLERGDQLHHQSIVVESVEKLDGRLDNFNETLASAGVMSTTRGTVLTNQMELRQEGKAGNSVKQIAWPAGSWGPLGIHQLLLRKPIQPGEARRAHVFLPQMHKLAQVTLVAGQRENITTPIGLLTNVVPVDVLMQLEKEGIRIRIWVDGSGRIQKTVWLEGLNLSSFRVSRETAAKLQAEDEIDSHRSDTLALDSAQPKLSDAEHVQYSVTSTQQPDPHSLFSSETNQTVKAQSVYDAQIDVYRPAWQSHAPPAKQTPPSVNELNGSRWLPVENAHIEQLAKQWSEQASDPTATAKKLLAAVHAHLRLTESSSPIHPIEAVAQGQQGNSTEQAMLLATLLRNRQIAARLACGVRLTDQAGKPLGKYHTWTEAWLDDQWLPMDATTGELTSCAYLKFIDTSLSDTDPYAAILTVLRNLKDLKIRLVSE